MAENVKQVEGAIEYLSAVIDGKALGLRAHAALHTIAAAARKAVPETTATTGSWLRHDKAEDHRFPLRNDRTDES